MEQGQINFEGTMKWCEPGIFRVDCIPIKRSLFGETDNVLRDVSMIYDKLRSGEFENTDLLKDFQNYGMENFDFVVVAIGPGLQDTALRKMMLQTFKNSWNGLLY